jgi:tRNA (Thr-GGU) A37 N-methylase
MGLLDGTEEYSHITGLYRGIGAGGKPVPRPRASDGRGRYPKKEIFSTCSPARPNPVLATVVRLHVRGETS